MTYIDNPSEIKAHTVIHFFLPTQLFNLNVKSYSLNHELFRKDLFNKAPSKPNKWSHRFLMFRILYFS